MNSSSARVPHFLTPITNAWGRWRFGCRSFCFKKRYFGVISALVPFNGPVNGTIRTMEPSILISESTMSLELYANGEAKLRKRYYKERKQKWC